MNKKPFKYKFNKYNHKFTNNSNKKKHSHIHTNNKPYNYQIQNYKKNYTHPNSLQKHIKIHNNISPTIKHQNSNKISIYNKNTNQTTPSTNHSTKSPTINNQTINKKPNINTISNTSHLNHNIHPPPKIPKINN